jgi:exoribonuclease-2
MQIKKPIPSPSKAAPAPDSSVGSLVQYDDEGQVILGLVIGLKKDKLAVLNCRGREGDLIRARLYFLPARDLAGLGTNAARVEALQKLSDEIEQDSQQHNIPELWGFVHEEAKQYSVAELCELYCGSNMCVQHAGLRVALIRDKIHFKRDKDLFEPRPQHVVEDLLKAESVKAKKKAAREQALSFIEQRTLDQSLAVPTELRDPLRLLEEVAAIVVHTDPARQKEAREFVHACAERVHIPESMPLEKRAFEVMQRAGFFHEHTNLAFIRHEIPVAFTQEVLGEAGSIRLPARMDEYSDDERSFRRDYTAVRAFTIDDASTRDMDDALSLERTPEGYELGIHITDVTVGVTPDSLLDKVARRRTTSIYCADQTVNMLPEELSEKVLSLTVGAPKPCLSVLLKLSDDFSIVSSSIMPSFVRISERYTYDQVDELLEHGDQTLLLLHDIAAASEERRIRKGAIRVQKREVVPIFENGAVVLQEIHEDSPARLLVSEMMVLANSVMAEFAARHGIPVLYRGQERPYDDMQGAPSEQAPEGPAKDFSARSKLKKSSVSFTPQHHAGLGLDAYIQATSPIRRYMDLCHQRQFISYQRYGRPWITQEQFESVAAELEMPLQAASLASRETKRYWLLRYLEQRPRSQPIEGTVVRTDLKSPLVELDEVYITIPVRMQQKASLGQRVSLKISAVDPHADYIRVS